MGHVSTAALLVSLVVAGPATAARRCLTPDAPPPEGLEALAGIENRFGKDTVLGGYFTNLLRDSGVSLCLDPESGECRGYYVPEANAIALRPGLPADEMALIVLHELRHLDQHARGYGPSAEYAMAENARQMFALEADAQAVGALFAWQRRAEDPGLWDAYLGFPRYRDIAVAFEASKEGGADDLAATRDAFRAWYHSDWRRRTYYLASCSAYLDLVDAEHLLPSYEPLPEGYFDGLCRLPDGRDYGCADTDEIGLVGVPRR
jgi:hypothetical protein